MTKILVIAVGSLAGGFARYYLTGFVSHFWGNRFPYGTLVVNLIGCFLIGIFSAVTEKKFLISPELRLLLIAGFCGAFTTFSAFMLETANLLKGGELMAAFANVIFSLGIGFLVFCLGVWLTEVMI